MDLNEFFQQNNKLALAFSGGVDSSYLLYAGVRAGVDIKPYYVKTAFQPEIEFNDAQRLAQQLAVELTVINLDVLEITEVTGNPHNRCYFCKTHLFTALWKKVQEDGYRVLIDGTNASDQVTDRPGMKALKELSVRSPLRECGLTKKQIRELSKQAGLFTWDKPAYACLATRIPTGTHITGDDLLRVEMAEAQLMALGFSDFRVRIFHDAARIQMPQRQFMAAVQMGETIRDKLAPYFSIVLLDLAARSSS